MLELTMILGLALTPLEASEKVNEFCSHVVGIPYASDNFTDEEWGRFVYCREGLKVPQQ
mgnify:FL=1